MAAKATPDIAINNDGHVNEGHQSINTLTSDVDYIAAETCDVLQKTPGTTGVVKRDCVELPDLEWENIGSPVEDNVITSSNNTGPHGSGEVAAISVRGGANFEGITHDYKGNGASQRNDTGAALAPLEVHKNEDNNTMDDAGKQDADPVHEKISDHGCDTDNFNSANHHVVIFFGRKGSGRKTIAKCMFPDIRVKEEGTRDMFTEMVSPRGDAAILVDLEPSLTGRHRRQTIQQYTRYLQGWAKENPDLQRSVRLLVFVFIRGCFTVEDLTMYEYMLTCLSTESYSVKSRIALVITHCEDLTAKAQSKVVENFNSNPRIKHVAEYMKENIICVGFPNLDEIMGPLKDSYSPVIENSKEKVNMVLKQATSVIENPIMLDTLFKIPNIIADSARYLIDYFRR